jgi:hypothetical protein
MRSSSSCNIDYCLTPYRSVIGFENRYAALRAEFFSITQRCNAPTPTPTITPTPTPTPTPDLAAREALLYQTALECIRSASSSTCSIDYCLTQYRSNVGFGDRYPALRAEYFRQTQRCNTPTPTPTLTPTPTPTSIPTPQPSAPRYTVYENSDIDGGDLPGKPPHLRDVDRSACELACNENSACVGYAYGKWDRACYLKGSLPDLRFDPNSTGAAQSNQRRPPDYAGANKIETTKRVFTGNRYSTTSTNSRQACVALCQRESACLAYQYVGDACWRYDQVDFAVKDDTALAGVKRQPAP